MRGGNQSMSLFVRILSAEYFFGYRSREKEYLNYVVKHLPVDTRDTFLEMATRTPESDGPGPTPALAPSCHPHRSLAR